MMVAKHDDRATLTGHAAIRMLLFHWMLIIEGHYDSDAHLSTWGNIDYFFCNKNHLKIIKDRLISFWGF